MLYFYTCPTLISCFPDITLQMWSRSVVSRRFMLEETRVFLIIRPQM